MSAARRASIRILDGDFLIAGIGMEDQVPGAIDMGLDCLLVREALQ